MKTPAPSMSLELEQQTAPRKKRRAADLDRLEAMVINLITKVRLQEEKHSGLEERVKRLEDYSTRTPEF